jgi:hypothetical protein
MGMRQSIALVLLLASTVPLTCAQGWEGKVSSNFLNTVIRIETAPDGANKISTGTGFLVGPDPGKTGQPDHVFLVTNKHMVGDWNLADGDVKNFHSWLMLFVYAPENAAGQRYTPVRVDLTDRFGKLLKNKVLLHRNPKVDIAAIVINKGTTPALTVLGKTELVPFDHILDYQTGLGDEVFALGYPFGIRSVKSGYPMAKVGHLASLPGEDFRLDTTVENRLHQKTVVSFIGKILIVDGLIVGGNSGGPLITAAGVRTIRDPKSNRLMFSSEPVPNVVIGIVSSTFDGAGLAVVYAADYINEVLATANP